MSFWLMDGFIGTLRFQIAGETWILRENAKQQTSLQLYKSIPHFPLISNRGISHMSYFFCSPKSDIPIFFIMQTLKDHHFKRDDVHAYFFFVCLICVAQEYGLLLLSARRSSATSLAFSLLLSLRPQIVPLGNRGHLSRLNCHTNRFLSAIQFVLGNTPTKTKPGNLKQQTYPLLTGTNCCISNE